MSGPEPEDPAGEPEATPRSRVDEILEPLYTDRMLWGLLAVMALVLGTFLASILLLALERRPFAIAALLGVAWMSVDGYRRSSPSGPPGPAARLILALWILAILIATGAHFAGLF